MKNFALVLALLFANFITAQQIAMPYRKGNLYGLCDTLGNIVTKPQYKKLENFYYFTSNGKSYGHFVVNAAGSDKVIDTEGKVLVDGKAYDSIKADGSDGFATRLYKGGKMGMAWNNVVFAKPIYDDIPDCSWGYFMVVKNKKYGIINQAGKEIIPIVHDTIESPWLHGDNLVYYNVYDDNVRTTIKFPLPGNLADPAFVVYNVDETEPVKEEMLTVSGYDSVISLKETAFAIVTKGSRYGLYNLEEKKLVLPAVHDTLFYIGAYKGHLLIGAKKETKFGIVNEAGAEQLPFEYDDIASNGLGEYTLKKNGLMGMYVPFTIYKPIPAVYESIEHEWSIPVSDTWTFLLFKAKRKGVEFFVGENGVEYYKP